MAGELHDGWRGQPGSPGEPGSPGASGRGGSGGTGGAGGAGGAGPRFSWLIMPSLAVIATLVISTIGFYLERQDSNEIRSNTARLAIVAKETCEIQRRDLREQRYIVGASRGFNRFLLLPPLVLKSTPRRQVELQRHIILEIRRNLRGYIAIEKQQPITRVC